MRNAGGQLRDSHGFFGLLSLRQRFTLGDLGLSLVRDILRGAAET